MNKRTPSKPQPEDADSISKHDRPLESDHFIVETKIMVVLAKVLGPMLNQLGHFNYKSDQLPDETIFIRPADEIIYRMAHDLREFISDPDGRDAQAIHARTFQIIHHELFVREYLPDWLEGQYAKDGSLEKIQLANIGSLQLQDLVEIINKIAPELDTIINGTYYEHHEEGKA